MQPSDFSGGESTVAKKVRELGFEVKSRAYKPRPPVFWALCGNPKRYRVADAVRELETDYWTIGRSDVRAGDQAVVWQTLDQGRRGVIAFAEIVGDPILRSNEENPYWIDRTDALAVASRVPVRIYQPPGVPLWVDHSENGQFLAGLNVARAQGGTVFKVTHAQWTRLCELASYESVTVESVEVEQLLRHGRPGGQGYGLTAKERSAVELHAMELARNHFEKSWESVTDVSSNHSYDFLCQNGEDALRVEVKGTTSPGDSVNLTWREVEIAGDEAALFVVSEIDLEKGEDPVASGGQCRLIFPWDATAHQLKSVSYTCRLDWSRGSEISV